MEAGVNRWPPTISKTSLYNKTRRYKRSMPRRRIIQQQARRARRYQTKPQSPAREGALAPRGEPRPTWDTPPSSMQPMPHASPQGIKTHKYKLCGAGQGLSITPNDYDIAWGPAHKDAGQEWGRCRIRLQHNMLGSVPLSQLLSRRCRWAHPEVCEALATHEHVTASTTVVKTMRNRMQGALRDARRCTT